ncbi:Plasmodium vivax Vir protein, putative [Plasmodium vivax]|uniref:Vir protein, putative n=1 Tax=Plasmodium vivax TaxID=5855 RepID=A0A1G4EB41_PLAVI|nr:Plasmodium vivax Vir protein, putative [Plasmodium vivax]
MAKHLTKGDIDKLTSKFNYSYFERGEKGCESLDFYSNIKYDLEHRYQIYNLHTISDKILKALCFIYNKKRNHQKNFDDEYCSYLYYWLGDQIYPLVQDKGVFSRIITMIYDELYSNIRENFIICRNDYSPIDQDKFKKNKVLFDYSKDYKKIDLDTVHGYTTCDTGYKEYLQKYINMYNDAYSDCYLTKEKKFDCNTFWNLFNKDQHEKFISIRCTESKNPRPSLQVQEPTGEVPAQTVHLLPDGSRDSNQISTPKALTVSHKNPGSQVPYALNEDTFLSMKDTTDGGSSKTIAGSVAPVLGVSSISLLLYKVIENTIDIHTFIIYMCFRFFK